MKNFVLFGVNPVAIVLSVLSVGAVVCGDAARAQGGTGAESRRAGNETRVPVTFTGGYATDPQDRGRPVVLVAAALGVPSEVFRATFRNVTPAAGGQEPEPGQVNRNKEALLRGLGRYGVTNDRLDEVSNYYRYNGSRGEMWRHTSATAYATIRDGKVVGFTITDPGAGYSSAPQVTVPGMPNLRATATVGFSTDLRKNGALKAITLGTSASSTADGRAVEGAGTERRDGPDRPQREPAERDGRANGEDRERRPESRSDGRSDERPDGRPERRADGSVPAVMLEQYLSLTGEQKIKLERLVKVMEALRRENFALQATPRLKLTDDQIRKIAEGGKVRTVLTPDQNRILEANPRPQFGGPGAPPPPR